MRFLLSIGMVLLAPFAGALSPSSSSHPIAASAPTAAPEKTVYDYSLAMPGGGVQSLADYRGKVLLIVNLASQSVYASELAALDQLEKTYADQGLVVLGIPSSDFGKQELSDDAAIDAWYKKQNLSFPIASKATLTGVQAIPLVGFLTEPPTGLPGGELHWNFTKFVLDRAGHPVMRMEASGDPADPEFQEKLEEVLNGTYKAPAAGKNKSSEGDEDDDDE